MKNSIIEVIKANKKGIIKKALIIGGTAVGLAIVAKVVKTNTDENEIENLDENDVETVETSDVE